MTALIRIADRRRRILSIAGALALLAVAAVASGTVSAWMRQADIADRGAEVMPFDLERTTHVFERLNDGGVQSVVADDPSDAEQIGSIRSHLQDEADKFRRGDFGDPATIHGDTMPGLEALRAGIGQIDVRYSELPDGAQLRYTTADPDMIMALDAWFAAQLSDHGPDATDPAP
ncbi:MAG: aspartate carbamoyltransferase [Chloroflexota bacterium]|nr:aspartate carbamoyltransferase [Chloroflexota bacterium]